MGHPLPTGISESPTLCTSARRFCQHDSRGGQPDDISHGISAIRRWRAPAPKRWPSFRKFIP